MLLAGTRSTWIAPQTPQRATTLWISTLADQAATSAGVVLCNYSRKVYAFPQTGCDWWGLSSVGGTPSRSWITGKLEIGVTAHELGHSLGLWHSHSLDCGASAVIGANCATNEYGDIVDMMGASHFRSLQRFPEGAFGLAQRGRIAADNDRRFKRNLYSRDIRVTHFWAKSVQDPKID